MAYPHREDTTIWPPSVGGHEVAHSALNLGLYPHTRVFVANWFVSEAWAIEDSGLTFENVTPTYAQQIAPDVPQPSTEVIWRITHPERFLTLDQVTSYPAIKLLGKRADRILQERR